MIEQQSVSRRTLIGGAAGLAALPLVGRASTALAAQATPVAADRQVLRWGGVGGMSRLFIGAYPSGLIASMGTNFWMPPFLNDASGAVLPGVCLDYDLSDDRTVYTFHLDPAAKFSDGTKVTAGDMKFTFEWLTNPASENPFPYYQTAGIAGQADVRSGAATEMAGLRVVDDETLEITLERPFASFVSIMSQVLTGIYQRKNIEEGAGWDQKPTVTCGPFMFESFDLETGEATAVPNPYWWREAPTLQRIEYRNIPDENTLLLLWESDEIDIFNLRQSLVLPRILTGPQQPFLAKVDGGYGAIVMALNATMEPTDDENVRRALMMATDVDTIIPAILGAAYQPAHAVSHPSTPEMGERPSFFDPEGARAALAASRYGNGEPMPPITIAVGPTSPSRPIVEAVQQMWQEVLGIEPAVLPQDPSFNAAELGAQAQTWGPFPLYSAPGDDLIWTYRANNLLFTSVGRNDDEVEALLQEAESFLPEQVAERGQLYRQAEDLILDRAYFIPLHYYEWWYLVRPQVQGVAFRPDTSLVATQTFIAEQ